MRVPAAVTTVQFRVDRFLNDKTHPAVTLPFVIWVLWPPAPKSNYPCDSCQYVYPVTDDSLVEFEKTYGVVITRHDLVHVCGCMGEVIE